MAEVRRAEYRALGLRLASAREVTGISQRALGGRLGLTSTGSIAAFEVGRVRPTPEVLRRLARILSLDVMELSQLAGYLRAIPGERYISVPEDSVGPLEVLAGYSPSLLVQLEGLARQVIAAGGWEQAGITLGAAEAVAESSPAQRVERRPAPAPGSAAPATNREA